MNDDILEAYGRQELNEYSHWVYVLECRLRWYCDDFSEYERRLNKRLDYDPDWKRMAWEARHQLYIGQTENLEKRLGQHFRNKFASDFTKVWEPTRIRFLKPCHSRQNAEYEEQRIGKSYYDSNTTYAYWK